MSLKVDGHFSGLRPNCVGDAYKDSGSSGKRKPLNEEAPPPFRVTLGGSKDEFRRLYEGEKHQDFSRVATAARMEGRSKFLTPNGFRYSSGSKFAYHGGYEGTFAKPSHMNEGTYDKKTKRRGPDDFEGRKIYTAPLKRCSGPPAVGAFRYSGNYTPTPKIMFTEYKYVPSEYDAVVIKEKAEREEMHRKTLERPAFKVSKEIKRPVSAPLSHSTHDAAKDTAESNKSAAAAADGTRNGTPKNRPMSAASARSRGDGNTGTGRRSSGGGNPEEERAPFRPSGTTKLYKYPEYLSDPYDDRKRREAQTCGRGLPPVPKKPNKTGEPKDPEEDKGAFIPPGPTKSKLTRSILFDPMNFRSHNQQQTNP